MAAAPRTPTVYRAIFAETGEVRMFTSRHEAQAWLLERQRAATQGPMKIIEQRKTADDVKALKTAAEHLQALDKNTMKPWVVHVPGDGTVVYEQLDAASAAERFQQLRTRVAAGQEPDAHVLVESIAPMIASSCLEATVATTLVFLGDEEGRLKRLPTNDLASMLAGRPLCGPIVIMGQSAWEHAFST